jgi:LPS O-antigen subunit length determinant protein (WzzB/FepE family)
MREVPRRSLVTTLWIIGGMAFAAAALTVIVRLLEA